MGRSKLQMELIAKEKNRKKTYQNRKNGIIKKAKELSVLCDVNTAIILYPPDSNQAEIWPENPHQIKNMIVSYKQKKKENGKRTSDLGDYFQTRKRKIEDELVKARERNMEAKYSTWFDELNGLSEGQLRQFAIGLENKEKTVRAHLERRKKRNFNHDVGSYPSLDEVQTLNDDLLSHDFGWLDDAASMEMAFGLGLKNNEPTNHNVGNLDQGQAIDDDFIPNVLELLNDPWFDDPQNVKMAFELGDNQPVNQNVASLDQVQVVNQDLGWFDGAPATPQKTEMGGFGFRG